MVTTLYSKSRNLYKYLKIANVILMNSLELTRSDIDQLVQNFRSNPNIDTFHHVQSWYENNINYFNDEEYLVCIYLFLVGANIRYRYNKISYEQHMAYVKEIREIINNASPLAQTQRKIYLDYGIKAGR